MTGRLLVDGVPGMEHLEYGSDREELDVGSPDPRLRRAVASCASAIPGGSAVCVLDPDEDRLGPDALDITPAQLREIIGSSRAPLKARLMDQHASPASATSSSTKRCGEPVSIRPGPPTRCRPPSCAACTAISATLVELGERGGSHTGDLQEERRRDGICPKDGTPLQRRTVGGRTTYSCPLHQL